MNVGRVMTTSVVTANGFTPVTQAAGLLRDSVVGCLVLVEEGRPTGIVTDRDLVTRCLAQGHEARNCVIGAHASVPVLVASPAMDLASAAHVMLERSVKRLIVVDDDGKLKGVLSLTDVARSISGPLQDILQSVGRGRSRRPEPERPEVATEHVHGTASEGR